MAGSEIPLRSYEALHGDRAVNDVLLKRVLYGISWVQSGHIGNKNVRRHG